MKATESKSKGSTLKIYLMKYMVVFVFITLILLWLFQIVFLEDFYSRIKIARVEDIVGNIEKVIKKADVDEYASPAIGNRILMIASNNDATAIITDATGTIYYNSEATGKDIIKKLFISSQFLELFQKARENIGEGQYISLSNMELFELTNGTGQSDGHLSRINYPPIDSNAGKGQSLIYAKIIENVEDKQVGIVVVLQITPVNTTVETLRVQLIYVTVIMLGIASLTALLISRKIARPIENITKAAKNLGKEDYNYQLGPEAISEVKDLNDTLHFVDSELKKTERIRKELIANISHDLRTPLTMIKGYSEVMKDLPGEMTKENIQIIIDEAERLQSLVNDILELSKIEEQNLELKIKQYNLTDSIKDIVERYRAMLASKGYLFEISLEEDIVVMADELKISQVIYNLLNNAVTYTGDDKSIRVSLKKTAEGKVRVSIADTGEGIPEDKLSDIWERYYKVDAEHKRAQLGSGLGLSIVKSIIEKHKGVVGVDTSPKGSVFWFELGC